MYCSLLIAHCSLQWQDHHFNTDDPEPVDFKHWEFYLSTINAYTPGFSQGTLPHFEINYGVVPDVQLHTIIPLNYINENLNENTNENQNQFYYGYAYTEFGIKYRFVKENDNTPQIGTFPIIEIPTSKTNEINNGKPQIYIPIWFQKSINKFTTYGGGGFWYNPGTGNRNWYFVGWQAQYDISKFITLGAEIFYHSTETIFLKSSTCVNPGGLLILMKICI